MGKVWKGLLVFALGFGVYLPPPKSGNGWSVNLPGPEIAIVIYGGWTIYTLMKVLGELPGVFALRRPLGVVRSGHEHLWPIAFLSLLLGFTWYGTIEDPDGSYRTLELSYGASAQSYVSLVAFGVFALLMWSLKLRACMAEANQRLGQDRASAK